MKQKYIHQFKKGDIVHFYGARFECVEDARESSGHRPMATHSKLPTALASVQYVVLFASTARKRWVTLSMAKNGLFKVIF